MSGHIAKMSNVETAWGSWELKNWNKCHALLAYTSSFFVTVGDLKLRFFLCPFEEKFTNDATTYISKWYSLWVELVSGQEQAYFAIDVQAFATYTKENRTFCRMKKNNQIIIDKTKAAGMDGKAIVSRELIRMDGCIKTADITGIWEVPLEYKQQPFAHWHAADDLRIELSVNVWKLEKTAEDLTQQMKTAINVDVDKLCTQLETLLVNDTEDGLHDVKFKLSDDVEVAAHRAILASGSPVFKTMFLSDMRESRIGEVEVPDINSDTMKLIVKCVYTGKMDYESCRANIEEVVYGASKYQLSGLLDYCDRNIISFCTNKNAVVLLRLAKLHGLAQAEKELKVFIESNSSKILLEMV